MRSKVHAEINTPGVVGDAGSTRTEPASPSIAAKRAETSNQKRLTGTYPHDLDIEEPGHASETSLATPTPHNGTRCTMSEVG